VSQAQDGRSAAARICIVDGRCVSMLQRASAYLEKPPFL
jgi:hypothetical protein